MRRTWAHLEPWKREAILIVAVGLPISYLTYIALGVSALLMGTPIELVGYGAGWTAMGLLTGGLGAGVGYKLAKRLDRRRVSAEGKERSDHE